MLILTRFDFCPCDVILDWYRKSINVIFSLFRLFKLTMRQVRQLAVNPIDQCPDIGDSFQTRDGSDSKLGERMTKTRILLNAYLIKRTC
jgi:hypothetical protein